MAQALLAGADVLKCIPWLALMSLSVYTLKDISAKIIRAPVPSVEKTLYYTLTLKYKFNLNLFQRYWWVKSVYIFLGHSVLVPSKHNTCKDQMFITTGLYLATCFGR